MVTKWHCYKCRIQSMMKAKVAVPLVLDVTHGGDISAGFNRWWWWSGFVIGAVVSARCIWWWVCLMVKAMMWSVHWMVWAMSAMAWCWLRLCIGCDGFIASDGNGFIVHQMATTLMCVDGDGFVVLQIASALLYFGWWQHCCALDGDGFIVYQMVMASLCIR